MNPNYNQHRNNCCWWLKSPAAPFLSPLSPADAESSLLPLAMFSRSLSCTLMSMRKAPSAARKQSNTQFNAQINLFSMFLKRCRKRHREQLRAWILNWAWINNLVCPSAPDETSQCVDSAVQTRDGRLEQQKETHTFSAENDPIGTNNQMINGSSNYR